MILLWGSAEDSPLRLVGEGLGRRNADVFFLDQSAGDGFSVEMDPCLEGGTLRFGSRSVELEGITAVYLRPHVDRTRAKLLDSEAALLAWADVAPGLMVNRPAAMTPNHSKPYQAALIASFGFDVPETLITTDPRAASDFWERHGSVVYKSVSSVRSIVARLTPAHRARLRDVCNCPTQFQAYVAGTDYRVHVVGDRCFACRIDSTADDYRYALQAGLRVEIHSDTIPEELAERCLVLAAGLDLPLAGIDMRRTPENRWYCFEVNPSPAFSFYEEATGEPIADAVARLLLSGRPGLAEFSPRLPF